MYSASACNPALGFILSLKEKRGGEEEEVVKKLLDTEPVDK